MGYRTNTVNYNYKAKIDLSQIIEAILGAFPDGADEVEIEDDVLYVIGSDNSPASIWSCRETLESPAEYEVELKNSVKNYDIKEKIITALKGIKKENISVDCEIDYESFEEAEDYGPDPDSLPGGHDNPRDYN